MTNENSTHATQKNDVVEYHRVTAWYCPRCDNLNHMSAQAVKSLEGECDCCTCGKTVDLPKDAYRGELE